METPNNEIELLTEVADELLLACRHALKVLKTGDGHPSMLVTHLQAAIAKAQSHAKAE